ncbi:putative voltage-gated chloride channel [Piedraia hortae CBS 480.64]|uniref:Putative voltage-gated chloride channel n=1 Tax=Piedraia hortae CBS 480.64 TaxID=1314780 RepID=A0A6A7C5I9_9PEZI|nr:putative voltage-gated chloride channel [Piedraia hortae CBS 480.64]
MFVKSFCIQRCRIDRWETGSRLHNEDIRAIDWIREYSKERSRLRHLAAGSPGWVRQMRLAADSSQVWCILVLTGIAVGSIAAGIDVASDWLGDLKQGVCGNVAHGGKFYLARPFCCWGAPYAECADWRSWSVILGASSSFSRFTVDYFFFLAISLVCASCASVLVIQYSPEAKQSGIPEIKTLLGGFIMHRFLGVRTLVIKSLGLCLAVASGMWLGKEGPLVHVACCCANVLMRFSPGINENEARKRATLSAAAASGISVAFGAPIGGVLFSLEQLSHYFPDKTMWASFVCATVAAVTLQALDPFRTGKLVLYQVTYHSGWHMFELVPFVLIGILGGFWGVAFIVLNMRFHRTRASTTYIFRNRPVAEVAAVALLTAVVSFPISFLRAQSSELVEMLFAECRDIHNDHLGLCKAGVANTGVIFLLLFSAGIGLALAAITFGLEIPAGILLPSMAVGALYGRAIGLVVEAWQRQQPHLLFFGSCEPDQPCVTPGTYAVVGAAAALAGTTRMTVSIVVIMFELTGALTYVLPIMVAVMVAKWVADAFGKQGIYETWISFRNYPFLDQRMDEGVGGDLLVRRIMTPYSALACIPSTGETAGSLRRLLVNSNVRGFPVIISHVKPTLLGYISRNHLEWSLGRDIQDDTPCFVQEQPTEDTIGLDLKPWVDETPITLSPHVPFHLVRDLFDRLGVRHVLFTEQGTLAGLLTKKDLCHLLDSAET